MYVYCCCMMRGSSKTYTYPVFAFSEQPGDWIAMMTFSHYE